MTDPRVSQGAAVVIAGVVALLSWRAGYQPAVQSYRRAFTQHAMLQERVAQWESILQSAGGQEVWLTKQQQRLDALTTRFPRQAQLPQLLNTLVDTLKTGDLKLINVSQGNVETVNADGQPLTIGGVPCYRLPVTIVAEGRYHALRMALERITQEEFPGVVSVAQVDFRLKDATSSKLDATLRLYIYVIGSPSGATPHA